MPHPTILRPRSAHALLLGCRSPQDGLLRRLLVSPGAPAASCTCAWVRRRRAGLHRPGRAPGCRSLAGIAPLRVSHPACVRLEALPAIHAPCLLLRTPRRPASVLSKGSNYLEVEYDNGDRCGWLRRARACPADRAPRCCRLPATLDPGCPHCGFRPLVRESETRREKVDPDNIFPYDFPLDFGEETLPLEVCCASLAQRPPSVVLLLLLLLLLCARGVLTRPRAVCCTTHTTYTQVGEFVEVSNNSKSDPCAWLGVVCRLGNKVKVRWRWCGCGLQLCRAWCACVVRGGGGAPVSADGGPEKRAGHHTETGASSHMCTD
jgi:hypothetical protein